MADSTSNRGSPDNKRVDIADPDEVRDWTDSLHATPARLKKAVAAVGTSAAKVRQYLNDSA